MAGPQTPNIIDRLVVGILSVLVVAFVVHLYFLSGISKHNPASLVPNVSIQDARIRELEATVLSLESQRTPVEQTKATGASDQAYQRGLRAHEALVDEVRVELKVAQDELQESNDALKTAREATQRMQDSEAAFLAIFTIIGALVVGQGYFQIRGWNERAQETLKDVEDVKPALDSIRAAHQSLETELPRFLDEARGILNVEDPTGPIQQKDIALIEQIDHFTYLNVPMRFGKMHSDEAANYIEGLRVGARAHLARNATWEAIKRLNEFFTMAEKFPDAVTEKNKALAFAYRALAAFQQLEVLVEKESWIRQWKADEVTEIRDQGLADLKSARECYKQQNYGDYVEALLYSLKLTPEDKDSVLRGQEKAVELYRKLGKDSIGRKRWASLQNLACCLMCIADVSGDPKRYLAFKTELQTYPSDEQLKAQTADEAAGRFELRFLWQSMMIDDELFGSTDKVNAKDCGAFWVDLLDKKVALRKWRQDYTEMQTRYPKMKGWAITLQ